MVWRPETSLHLLRACRIYTIERSTMNSTATSADSQTENLGARLQKLAIGALFAAVLLVPKILDRRRAGHPAAGVLEQLARRDRGYGHVPHWSAAPAGNIVCHRGRQSPRTGRAGRCKRRQIYV